MEIGIAAHEEQTAMHHGTCAATLELNLATRRQFHELLAVDLAIELDELAGASGYAPRDQRRCGAKAAGFSTAAISEQLTALRALEDGMLGMQHRIGVLRAERTQAGAERGGPHGCAHADDDDGTSSVAGSDISATDSEISAATTVPCAGDADARGGRPTSAAAPAKPRGPETATPARKCGGHGARADDRVQQLRARLGLPPL